MTQSPFLYQFSLGSDVGYEVRREWEVILTGKRITSSFAPPYPPFDVAPWNMVVLHPFISFKFTNAKDPERRQSPKSKGKRGSRETRDWGWRWGHTKTDRESHQKSPQHAGSPVQHALQPPTRNHTHQKNTNRCQQTQMALKVTPRMAQKRHAGGYFAWIVQPCPSSILWLLSFYPFWWDTACCACSLIVRFIMRNWGSIDWFSSSFVLSILFLALRISWHNMPVHRACLCPHRTNGQNKVSRSNGQNGPNSQNSQNNPTVKTGVETKPARSTSRVGHYALREGELEG